MLDFIVMRVPVPVVIARAPDFRATRVNALALELAANGAATVEHWQVAPAQDLWAICHPDGTPYSLEDHPIVRAINWGVTTTACAAIMHVGRDERHFSINAAPLSDESGTIIAGIVIFLEITSLRRHEHRLIEYQDRLQGMAARLLTVAALERRSMARELHDGVAQTLTAALLRAGRIADDGPVGLRERLVPVCDLLEQAAREVRLQVLALTPPLLDELGLAAAIEYLVESIGDQWGTNITFRCSSSPFGDSLSRATELAAIQATGELITNAATHSRADLISVELVLDGAFLRFLVRDDGVGFVPSSVRPDRETGQYYGLFSVREQLRRVGSHLLLESQPGKGTLGMVLVADDHEIVREGLAALLGGIDEVSSVVQAADGREAVEVALRMRPDLVVMDVSMPGLNGIEATRQILAQVETTRVVALSMHSGRRMVIEILRAGAVGYLPKESAFRDSVKRCVSSYLGSST